MKVLGYWKEPLWLKVTTKMLQMLNIAWIHGLKKTIYNEKTSHNTQINLA